MVYCLMKKFASEIRVFLSYEFGKEVIWVILHLYIDIYKYKHI